MSKLFENEVKRLSPFPEVELATVALPSLANRRESEMRASTALVEMLFGGNCKLGHEPSGAPFLECSGIRDEAVSVSLSHCRDSVALAYSRSYRVGVDVETLRPQTLRVGERVFSAEELRHLGMSLWKHTLAWTAKEALYKCALLGGIDFRADIRLFPEGIAERAACSEYAATVCGEPYRVVSLFEGEHIITTAISENHNINSIIKDK